MKIIVSICCMLVILAGVSCSVFAEQNKEILIAESGLLDADAVSYKVIPDIETNARSSVCVMDTLDQQQTVESGYSAISENGYYAQSFVPTLGELTRVELKLFKKGTPTGLTVSIRSDLTNPDLTSKYLPASAISTSATWIEFNFPDITVTPGHTYYIVWDPIGVPDFNNNFFWHAGAGNPYTNGVAWIFLGVSWEIYNSGSIPNPDFCFKTYGLTTGNNPPNKPSTPSGPITGDIDKSLHYESYISDPDGDGMEVYFDWGDGTHTGWVGILTNGTVGNYKTWTTVGTYQVRVKARDTPYLAESPWSDSLTVTIGYVTNSPPNKPTTPTGDSSGKIGVSYTYESSTTDPNGDQIYYWFDWGDSTTSGWIGPFNSGDICQESHIWTTEGSYSIKVKAKDAMGAESVWSDPLPITMPYSYNPMHQFFERLFQRFPNTFPLLRQLLGY